MIGLQIEHLTVSWNGPDKRSSERQSHFSLKLSFGLKLNLCFVFNTIHIGLKQRQLQKQWKYFQSNGQLTHTSDEQFTSHLIRDFYNIPYSWCIGADQKNHEYKHKHKHKHKEW